jgi:transcriptional regulator with XRE-family HTH domain
MTETATKASPLRVAERIKAARKEAGITNAELARRLQLDPRTVAGYQAKKPRSQPSFDRLVQIAAILDKPPSYFIDPEVEAA